MISRWRRMSRILAVPSDHPWWVSHAQIPTVIKVHGTLWRICLSGRDGRNRANVIVVDVDPTRDMTVLSVSEDRPLTFGGPGAMDRDGVGVTCAIEHDGLQWWVGGGMNVRDHPHYQISSFWVTSPDNGLSFEKVDAPPILVPGPHNPLGGGMAHLLHSSGQWHMWFTSMRPWQSTKGGPLEPTYDIRHAVSDDLRNWAQDDAPCIARQEPAEAGIVRPCVQRGADGYEMWYSVRGPETHTDPGSRAYRLGYATSPDALRWTRRDDAFLFENPPAPEDWDADMQCYPTVVAHAGARYLFYSGNDFGRTGFGYAVEVVD